ncbi:two-domain glycosyltransferase [Beggiatoa sp. PS]|nr:two-domain glycosyltransferase [Beggiatoa sp. PS]
MLKISVIITTYNRPDALALVLQALAAQTSPRSKKQISSFEVVIADDGSTSTTTELINQLQPHLPYHLQHIWQEDQGFRAAQARNRAVVIAQGNYLIFLDGDCIPQTDFIAKHIQLAEKGWFVAGNRILLSQKFTAEILQKSSDLNCLKSNRYFGLQTSYSFPNSPLWTWHTTQWLLPYLRRDINRFLPLIKLPLNQIRKRHHQKWQGAKTCNLAVWRKDILTINGFDERFQGWGHEDADLVVRLLRSGVYRKEGRFAVPVLHLWHLEEDRSQEPDNRQRLEKILNSTTIVAQQGIKK